MWSVRDVDTQAELDAPCVEAAYRAQICRPPSALRMVNYCFCKRTARSPALCPLHGPVRRQADADPAHTSAAADAQEQVTGRARLLYGGNDRAASRWPKSRHHVTASVVTHYPGAWSRTVQYCTLVLCSSLPLHSLPTHADGPGPRSQHQDHKGQTAGPCYVLARPRSSSSSAVEARKAKFVKVLFYGCCPVSLFFLARSSPPVGIEQALLLPS
ncbi:hypothetical protein V8E36_004341 [Tilletia maclaganii]